MPLFADVATDGIRSVISFRKGLDKEFFFFKSVP